MEMDRKTPKGDSDNPTEATTQMASVMPLSDEELAITVITTYLLAQSKEFRQLSQLRQQGWKNPEGDKFFADQRTRADATHSSTSQQAEQSTKVFFKMMQSIGLELQASTGAFDVIEEEAGYQPRILDLCMAPGGFLFAAMQCNPDAIATAYSLPFEAGGHRILLPENENIKTTMLDITMLAADMDANSIPEGHPDFANFLPKHFSEDREFDIVLCDGQVLRTHLRADYRAHTEARRLSVTQLALGLGHLRRGGTMVVLLHRLEGLITLELLHLFAQFSSVQLFKPPRAHAKRSSFYMVATNVQVEHPEAVKAVRSWKHLWKIATFGGEEEYKQLVHKDGTWSETIVKDFGPAIVQLGRPIWAIQARALANAPFIKGSSAAPQTSRQWRRVSKLSDLAHEAN
ncbi:hypothetical protein MBLNU13_g08175t1 [Cladosporium sp. NU13]